MCFVQGPGVTATSLLACILGKGDDACYLSKGAVAGLFSATCNLLPSNVNRLGGGEGELQAIIGVSLWLTSHFRFDEPLQTTIVGF